MRNLVPVLVNLTALPFQETYWTCSLVFPDGESVRVAGSEIEIAGDKFQGGLITVSGLRASLGNSVDRIDITVENVDWKWTKRAQIPRTSQTRALVGRAVRPIRGGSWAFLTLLNGVLVTITSNEKEATLSCIADLYAAPAIGALTQYARPCQFKYRDPRTCGFPPAPESGTDPFPTCDLIYESPGGCAGKNWQHRYGGFLGDTEKETLSIPPPDPNYNPDQGGGGIGGGGYIYDKYDNPYLIGP